MRATPLLTRAALVVGGAIALTVAVAAPAAADAPVGWEDPDPLPLLQVLLIVGGGVAVAVVLVLALVLGPALVQGSRRDPELDWWRQPQWFGDAALDSPGSTSAAPRALEAAPSDLPGGGASARW